MSFFNELKRRNVIKVAAAYVIVSWLIMQAGEVMGPALRLPEWVNSLLAFFLILGFPLAMFFAWAFEITPEGIKKEKEVDPSQSIASSTGQKLNYTIIALLVAALGYFVWESNLEKGSEPFSQETIVRTTQPGNEKRALTPGAPGTGQTPDKKSIAVIPFRNRSANEENSAFFSDGVHDELLTNLAKIGGLKVISRTSVMSYRDTTKNLRQIGTELGVANILEGGVQRAGDSVRINVQLIDAATDEHLWARVYDRQLSAENIFAIQSEIALEIANALEATLSPREQEMLAATPTVNLDAYDNLLLARQLMIRGNWQDLRDALAYLQEAIELDSMYVEAHVSLARTYFGLVNTGATTLAEISLPWEKAVQTALKLDGRNATAHAARAQYLWITQQDGVDNAFAKALQLEPRNSDIMAMYGEYLRKNYAPDRALPLYEQARDLDPVSTRVLYGLARIHEARGEYDQALEVYARMRQIDPTNASALGPTAGPYQFKGDLVKAMYWLFQALSVDPDDSDLHNWIAQTYIDLGDFEQARRWYDWIEESTEPVAMAQAGLAMLSIQQGDIPPSIDPVRQAYSDELDDRWTSGPMLVRALHIWALDTGNIDTAIDMLKTRYPELFEPSPRITVDNVMQAIDIAGLLQKQNHHDSAQQLLTAVIDIYAKPFVVSEVWMVSGKAQALALLGEKRDAMDKLRSLADKGWRVLWRWETELNPNFESLHRDPEFKDIVESMRADMARQLKDLKIMEASGDIPPPPELGRS